MASLRQRVTATVARLRAKYAWLDHTVRTVQHYGRVNGNGQAGAVTYFGFLSFFPILAIAFFFIGLLAQTFPDIRAQMVTQINNLLPGVIGDAPGQIKLKTIEDASATLGIVGLLVLLYSGLGWLSGMRAALEVMFAVPRREHPNLLVGKTRDLAVLALIGVILLVSVVLSGAVTGFSGRILGWLGVDPSSTVPSVLLSVTGHALAIGASTVLLLTMFKLLLLDSHVPRPALVRGALLGAVGFEILKLAANLLLTQTRGNPAFQAFGVALILLVWINYFSRLVMYSAAWAYTSTRALDRRTAEAMRAPGAVLTTGDPDEVPGAVEDGGPRTQRATPAGVPVAVPVRVPAAVVGVATGSAVALMRGRRRGGAR